ncbi:MAG: hypothetical protein HYT46_02025 [Candidatus Vogelbacteria bacterium]|nr:hypothetical protein [Candidatus Vogelbacteria bacterium]
MNEQTSQPQESLSTPSLSADSPRFGEAGEASVDISLEPPSARPAESGNLISGGNQISSKSRGPLIALLFILALGFGGWLAWRYWPVVPPPNDAPAPVEATNIEPPASAIPINGSEIDTSNWKTYRNDEYGFEVKYPEEWCVGRINQTPSQNCEGYVSVDSIPPGRYSVESYNPVVIGGRAAGETGWTDPGAYMAKLIIFSDPSISISLSFQIGPNDAQKQATADQILSTFRFIK